MTVVASNSPKPISLAQGATQPDLIYNPFTVPREVRQSRPNWLFSAPSKRATAPDTLLGPDGQVSKRTKRPDDFATADQATTPLEPEKPYDKSPFWHTNIDTACFHPRAFSHVGTPNATAVAIPNSFPFKNCQELIVFPHTEAVSISQLGYNELTALAELMKDRYEKMIEAGYPHVWFGMHRGKDGGGTLEHIHFQVYASRFPEGHHANIWDAETDTGLSEYNFQRLDGRLTIAPAQDAPEIISPYTGGYPLGMEVAYTYKRPGEEGYLHFADMERAQITIWLYHVADAVRVLEDIPLTARPNGMWGYSLSFVVPPKDHTISPMRFSIHPAKLRSTPYELSGVLENPVNPFNAKEVLEPLFNR